MGSLDDITPEGVFDSVLADAGTDEPAKEELGGLYAEILEAARAAEREDAAAAETARADIAQKADGKQE